MNISGIIVVLMIACLARLFWKIHDTYTIQIRRRDQKTGTETDEPQEPIAIPENDKDWHLRYNLIERIKRGLVDRLENSPSCNVRIYSDDELEEGALTHGEAYEVLMPFLEKGYFAYKYNTGYSGDKVKRFRVTKHRDPEKNALEITEELLTKNAQL